MIPSTLEVEAQEGTVTVKQEEALYDSLSRKSSSTILPSRDWESPSIPELTRRHGSYPPSLVRPCAFRIRLSRQSCAGFDYALTLLDSDISVVVVDGEPDFPTHNLATVRTPGTSGPAGDRNDLPAQETSTIGSLSRFFASPTAG